MVRVFYRATDKEEAFDGAQAILGAAGDPRELFVQLAAGSIDKSRGRPGTDAAGGFFRDRGLGSDIFGDQRKVPEAYGVPFETSQERILGPVEREDLPPGVEEGMVLVERNLRLTLVSATEIQARITAGPEPWRPFILLGNISSDEDLCTIRTGP